MSLKGLRLNMTLTTDELQRLTTQLREADAQHARIPCTIVSNLDDSMRIDKGSH